MSYNYSGTKNKHPKVYIQQYLYGFNEPRDDISNDTPQEDEAELLENSFDMRRSFRHTAEQIRSRYS